MLDKLEEAYAILSTNREPLRDSTYKAAILLATLKQYQHVVNTIIQLVNTQNKSKNTNEWKTIDSKQLIIVLQNLYNNYCAKKSLDTNNQTKNTIQANIAYQTNNNKYRKVNRADSKKTKCFNCGKGGHFSKECHKPLTKATKLAWAKYQAVTANVANTNNIMYRTLNATTSSENKPVTVFITNTKKKEPFYYSAQNIQDINMNKDNNPINQNNQDKMFAWVCTNVFTNTIITNNKSYMQTLDLLNSSASIHATPYLFWLTDIHNITPIIVTIANKLIITLKQAGSMCIQVLKKK